MFADEITEADRAGKQTTTDALKRLTPEQQRGVLGKARAEALSKTGGGCGARVYLKNRYGEAAVTGLGGGEKSIQTAISPTPAAGATLEEQIAILRGLLAERRK